jgi:hypothetical protein
MRCTLSRTIVCSLALLAGACGGGDSGDGEAGDRTERFERTPLNRPAESGTLETSACELIPAARVARAIGRSGTQLRAKSNDSTDLSVCDWRGGGLRVQLVLDSAPRAQLRFYNQHAEQLQFHNADPRRRPYQLKGVGQDSAYGGAGAWWTRTKNQLVAYSHERILRIRIVGGEYDDVARRRASARLARLTFRRL